MTDLLHKDVLPTNPIDAAAMEVLHVDPALSPDAIAESYPRLRDKLEFMKRKIVAAMDELDERACDWIRMNGRDITYTVDDKGHKMRLYLSHPKTVKCRDVRRTVQSLLKHCDGDWDRFESCLSSSAIKIKPSREILPSAEFLECFQTIVKDKLESGEIAPKELTNFDERFSK